MSNFPPPVVDAAPRSTYTCAYCRLDSDGSATSCAHCGAPVDVRARVSVSGWESQPAIADMAKIQFAHSTVQISGMYVPAAEFRLAPGEGVFFSHTSLLWADEQVQLGNQPLKGAWNRKMAGLDLVMMEATGPGTMALSDNHAGETIAVPLMPGRAVDVREHRFLCATLNVGYDWFQSGVWYTTRDGDETETHYPAGMYVDRFTATDTPGLLMLHGRGNVFLRDLAPGQTICIHPGSFVWKDASVSMMMHLERPASGGWFVSWQPSTPWLRLAGPGRVAMSSAYDHAEGTGRIVNSSAASTVDWNSQHTRVQIDAMRSTLADRFDDGPFEAALDAFAQSQGFAIGKDKNRAIARTHEYRHPGGIDIVCTVVDTSTATAVLSNLSGVLGSRSSLLTNKLNKAMANMGQKGGEGEAVDGLGSPATWRRKNDKESSLAVVKGARTLTVTIESSMSPQDQLAWLKAWAAVALPTV